MSKKMKWGIAGAVVVAAGAAFATSAARRGEQPTEVRIEAVDSRDLVASVTASGQVQPRTKVDVAADISGRIVRLSVKEGQMVKRGDFLLQIDPEQYEAAVQRAEAGLSSAKAQAAQEARDQLVKDLGKALGLVKDDEKLTPEQLAEQVSEAKDAAKQARVELAVYRGAGKKDVGADPDALLDSRGFLAKLADLDPDAKDFDAKVATAMKDAVKNNPKLKASQAGAGSSSVDHGSGGSGEKTQRKSKGLAGAVGGHYGT